MGRKGFNVVYLLLASAMLYGCSSSEASQSKSTAADTQLSSSVETVTVADNTAVEETESKAQEQNIYSETNADGIGLELVDISGSDPIYSLTFKKKDMNTGNYLNYSAEGAEDDDKLANVDVKVEPDSKSGFGYWLEPEDECHVDVYNIDGNDSIKVTIDGLSYTFSPKKEKQEEKVLDKSINIKDELVKIKKAVLYPEYVALYLEEGTDKVYENMFLAIDSKGEKIGPMVFENDNGKVLVYKKENVVSDNTLHLQAGQNNEFESIDIELN